MKEEKEKRKLDRGEREGGGLVESGGGRVGQEDYSSSVVLYTVCPWAFGQGLSAGSVIIA